MSSPFKMTFANFSSSEKYQYRSVDDKRNGFARFLFDRLDECNKICHPSVDCFNSCRSLILRANLFRE